MELILMRHAEAIESLPDFDRRLTVLGRNMSFTTGQIILMDIGWADVDMALVSSAKRTKETYEMISKSISIRKVIFPESIYLGNSENYLTQLMSVDSDVHRVLLIGHNPTIAHLAQIFKPGINIHFSPSSTLCFKFEGRSWTDLLNQPVSTKFIIENGSLIQHEEA